MIGNAFGLTEDQCEMLALHYADMAAMGFFDSIPSPYRERLEKDRLAQLKLWACYSQIGLKLERWSPLACVGEEICFYLLQRYVADSCEELEGYETLADLIDEGLEDGDLEMAIFSRRFDGIDQSEHTEQLGMASYRFEEWFAPFNEDRPVHPICLVRELT